MAEKKPEDMTVEEQREQRAAELRRANENRNQSMLDRRNAIADAADELREEELDDVDGDKIIKRQAKTAEQIEQDAAEEERAAEAERARLQAAPGERLPDDDDDSDGDPEDDTASTEPSDTKIINGVRHYLVVVKGKEKWLTLKELRDTSSKVEAADEYLQQAAESARRAVALQTSEAEEPEEVDAELEETLNKALLGDPESVKKLARRLQATPSRVTPDVLQAVDERLTFREAVNWFESEFKTELADPRLKEMIVREDVRLRDENPTMPYRKRLQTAGENIRKWRNAIGGGNAGSGTDGARPSKELRKRQMSQPAGAGGRQSVATDEDAEEPVSTQIERMAQSRHQARAIKH